MKLTNWEFKKLTRATIDGIGPPPEAYDPPFDDPNVERWLVSAELVPDDYEERPS